MCLKKLNYAYKISGIENDRKIDDIHKNGAKLYKSQNAIFYLFVVK